MKKDKEKKFNPILILGGVICLLFFATPFPLDIVCLFIGGVIVAIGLIVKLLSPKTKEKEHDSK